MKQIINKVILGAISTFGFSFSSWAIPVDLELVLLNDVSGSVSSFDYDLVKTGYRDAFLRDDVQSALTGGAVGSVAVTYIEWSGRAEQSVVVAWTLIDSAESAKQFGLDLFRAPRAFDNPGGKTALGSALNFAVSAAGGAGDDHDNGFEGTRSVIDVSGNGKTDEGADTLTASVDVRDVGIDTINGLVFGGDPLVSLFYLDNVIGGPDAFILPANENTDFGEFIKNQLIIGDPPSPVAECDIQLNQLTYVDGDTVTADVYRYANLTSLPIALEAKVWRGSPAGEPPISFTNLGSDGSVVLPPGTDVDVGPLPLQPVTSAMTRGSYEFSCRMLDPVTGELLAEDRNFFEIQ